MECLRRSGDRVLISAARGRGRPPRLDLPRPVQATERDRAEFARRLRDAAFDAPAARGAAPAAPPLSPGVMLRELQRGRRAVREDSEISLRGRTSADARRRLEDFLRARRSAGDLFVKVIHGKGYRSPEGRPVLAPRVPGWLGEWRPELVAAWGEARQDDGGRGALYVALTARSGREPKSASMATGRTRSSRSTHSSGP